MDDGIGIEWVRNGWGDVDLDGLRTSVLASVGHSAADLNVQISPVLRQCCSTDVQAGVCEGRI